MVKINKEDLEGIIIGLIIGVIITWLFMGTPSAPSINQIQFKAFVPHPTNLVGFDGEGDRFCQFAIESYMRDYKKILQSETVVCKFSPSNTMTWTFSDGSTKSHMDIWLGTCYCRAG